MPNGESKNWIRLLITLEDFWLLYNCWPTTIHLYGFFIEELREMLSENDFEKLQSKIKLIPDDNNPFLAVDESGNKYDYCHSKPYVPQNKQPVDVRAWLDINEPDYYD